MTVARPLNTFRMLSMFLCLTIIAIAGETWWGISLDRELTIESEAGSALIVVRSIHNNANIALLEVETVIHQSAAEILRADDQARHSDAAIIGILVAAKKKMSYLDSLSYINKQGLRYTSANPYPLPSLESERFRYSQPAATKNIRIDDIVSNDVGREQMLPVERDLYDSHHQFAGRIIVNIKISHFMNFYDDISKRDDIILLTKENGTLLLRLPFDENMLNLDVRNSAGFKSIHGKNADEGSVVSLSTITGKQMLLSYKKIPQFSLLVTYGRTMDDILIPWRKRTLNSMLLSAAVVLLILGMFIVFSVYQRRRHKSDVILNSSEQRYRILYEESDDPIFLISTEMRYLGCNTAAAKFLGIADKQRLIGRKVGLFFRLASHRSQMQNVADRAQLAMAGQPQQFEWITARGKRLIYTDVTLNRTVFNDGYAMCAILRDISARKRSEILQATQNKILHMVMAGEDMTITLRKITEFSDSQIPSSMSIVMLLNASHSHFTEIISTSLSEHSTEMIRALPILHGSGASGEVVRTLKPYAIEDWSADDSAKTLHALFPDSTYRASSAWPIFGKDGQILGVFTILFKQSGIAGSECMALASAVADLASIAIENRNTEERILHLAHYDKLTGLPNRFLCLQHIANALTHAEHRNGKVAVFLLDMDRFKNINDTFGHETGEAVLKTIATRFRSVLRELDILSRVGGDEFVVLIDDYEDPLQLSEIAQKLLREARRPFGIGEHEFMLSVSIGIATYPEDGGDSQTLIKSADIAMYRAKHTGKDDYRFYSEELNTNTVERVAMEADLRRALERREFIACYQPKIDLHSGKIVGAEALVRWRHPTRGLLFPGDFISLAEETGLVGQISLQVLAASCADLPSFLQHCATFDRLAVNLAGNQLNDHRLVDDIKRIIDASATPSSRIEFEITESMMMQNLEQAVSIMDRIRALGCSMSVDDFGTGYSSLAYLQRFPIDSVKVDKSFIDAIPDDLHSCAIVQAIIAMARVLKLKVIIEGVETTVQLAAMQQFGADEYQGFLFSKALPAAEFLKLLQLHATPDELVLGAKNK
ncbi:EAL domain-containing protein [Herbaspirillum sp. RTI4]|uniref:EAL domain-containing protein n=1 Tax=Herbaspirillum sp. RTI4 TaxID=3048640 RepID=UPI002AB54FB6|nr:EAL domain-containing protein [Herbaspirillum sp. RTI4]MDY7578870.1 EAL domain-containing protein [Herbaspirillum sp. RTI4]MEA9983013.1 EAL domain-containing protein [Herbaspirillum sp. RTI4]